MDKFLLFLFIIPSFCIEPPKAKKLPHQIQIHNKTWNDEYYWLNQKDDDWVLNYLNSENEYRDQALSHTTDLQEELYNEMTDRLPVEEFSVPYSDNGFEYRKIYLEKNDYEIYQRRQISKKNLPWETILDVNKLAEKYDYADIGWIQPSPNNQYLAFGIDTQGNYRFYIKIINLITGELLKENIPYSWGKCIWHPDSKRFYYSEKDHTNRNLYIKQHWLGFNDPEDNKIIFEEKDSLFSVYISQSKSDRYMFLGSESTNTTEFSYIDFQDNRLKINTISPRKKHHLYYPLQHENYFYILTNSNNHIENKIVKVPIENPQMDNWETKFTPKQNYTFENFTIIKNHIIIKQRNDVKPSYQIINLETDSSFTIKFDEELYYMGFKDNYNENAEFFRFEFSSPKTPEIIYDYHFENNELTVKYSKKLNHDFDSNNYTLTKLYVPDRKNETQIPLTLIYRTDFFQQNGQNPILLSGYGAYGSITDSYFINSHISLLDRGVVIAFAHIRGSGDLGKKWYEDGKMFHKMNTFTDFIDCAKFLIDNNYTSSNRLFAQGVSAGGLLMGAVSNLAPELFKGIIAEVPFVDVITTMSDASLPLTTQEYEEWGNPTIREYFDYMMKYSPYDNIEKKDYPAMFVTASYNDSQVGYWEPAKYVAKLREFKTDNNPLILSTDMTGSHSGPSGRFSGYKLIGLEWAFLLDQVGFIHQGNQ